jgi:hypothetical protein
MFALMESALSDGSFDTHTGLIQQQKFLCLYSGIWDFCDIKPKLRKKDSTFRKTYLVKSLTF